MHKIYKSEIVIKNKTKLVEDLTYCKERNLFSNYTWEYYKYNVFMLNPNSLVMNKLCIELKKIIRDYLQTSDPLWMQCWLNFHEQNEILNWHNHAWPYHGYISVRPHNTTTVFKNFEIKNKTGNVYIGPGNLEHKVKIDKKFITPRITIGFDVKTIHNKVDEKMMSLMPI
jgi:hypothetical protein